MLGISKSVQGYVELPNVEREVAAVHDIEGGQELLNDSFSRARFEAELRRVPYNIVHIASHGQFGNDPSQTFVLAFDGQLTMDDLERDIKFGERRDKALELLILSACETASGDDRAALGLAGVALKAGARSALATLWYISDKASGELVVNFYRGLQSGKLSKAHALQAGAARVGRRPALCASGLLGAVPADRQLAVMRRLHGRSAWSKAGHDASADRLWLPHGCRRTSLRRTTHRRPARRMTARQRSRPTSRRRAAHPAGGSAVRRAGQ